MVSRRRLGSMALAAPPRAGARGLLRIGASLALAIPSHAKQAGVVLFLACALFRLLYLFVLSPPAPVGLNAEPQPVAMSLATTGEFANPYLLPTGPTAHVAPLHPLLLSAILRNCRNGYPR